MKPSEIHDAPPTPLSHPGFLDSSAEKALKYLLADAGITMANGRSANSSVESADVFGRSTNSSNLSPQSPTPDIQVRDHSFYRNVLLRGSMGLGDSYIEGKWDSPAIDKVIIKILESGIYQKLAPVYDIVGRVRRKIANLQDREGSKKVIEEHYDLPVAFYEAFLDQNFQYTCARFEGTDDLDEAQIKKMHNICKKLHLKPGDKVLDVGGGWGGLARFMADEYGAKPTVVTLSSEQADHIRKKHGGKVEVFEGDYRDMPDEFKKSFDAISAVGMLEHVGHENYQIFMQILHGNLKKGGRVLVHSLYTPHDEVAQNPWVNKHIFPNGELAPRQEIEAAISQHFQPATDSNYPGFEDLSKHYPPTLHAWKNRLNQSRQAGKVQMTDKEFRKWEFYFMLYAGAIKAGHVKIGQFLYEE